ncbi:MAG: urea transporter [Rubellimicrobium sp.]|nr:urea transporter [Rubellimicrobium sp.]
MERPFPLGRDPAGAVGGAVLCGLGQVVFLPSRAAGALFLVAVALVSPMGAVAGAVGALIGTAVGALARVPAAVIREGHCGFNGALAAMAPVFFAAPVLAAPGVAALSVAAAALASALWLVLSPALARLRLPVLTAPFNLAALALLAPVMVQGVAQGGPAAAGVGVALPQLLLRGTVNGLAQVFLVEGLASGAVVALGLIIASRRAAVLGVAGSAAGTAVALALGLAPGAVGAGLYGYNAALVAVALGAIHVGTGRGTLILALAGAGATVPLHAALSGALATQGLPAFTLSFVIVTWAGVALARATGLHPATGGPADG